MSHEPQQDSDNPIDDSSISVAQNESPYGYQWPKRGGKGEALSYGRMHWVYKLIVDRYANSASAP